MKLVILNGALCSGKSTIIKNIMKEKEGYFHLSYDSLKWEFSKYTSGKYTDDIHEIMLSMLETLCKQKHNVLGVPFYKESRENLINLAKKYGYEIVEINLEASWEVLSQRFEARMTETSKNPEMKVANRTPDKFKKLFDIYESEKNPAAIVVRTDTLSIDEASAKVIELL